MIGTGIGIGSSVELNGLEAINLCIYVDMYIYYGPVPFEKTILDLTIVVGLRSVVPEPRTMLFVVPGT
jgi:hypothetical protein